PNEARLKSAGVVEMGDESARGAEGGRALSPRAVDGHGGRSTVDGRDGRGQRWLDEAEALRFGQRDESKAAGERDRWEREEMSQADRPTVKSIRQRLQGGARRGGEEREVGGT
ncbi:unnamed protein product, partial [Laminaria digitata]